jgi:hypothetical protein
MFLRSDLRSTAAHCINNTGLATQERAKNTESPSGVREISVMFVGQDCIQSGQATILSYDSKPSSNPNFR